MLTRCSPAILTACHVVLHCCRMPTSGTTGWRAAGICPCPCLHGMHRCGTSGGQGRCARRSVAARLAHRLASCLVRPAAGPGMQSTCDIVVVMCVCVVLHVWFCVHGSICVVLFAWFCLRGFVCVVLCECMCRCVQLLHCAMAYVVSLHVNI